MGVQAVAGMTRRQLLGRSVGSAAAGAALVAGGGAVTKMLLAPGVAEASDDSADVVVHIRGGSSGELLVMRGESEELVHDAQLVNRLRRAAG